MTAHLIGFVGQAPERLSCLLERFRGVPWLAAADGMRPWGAGQYMDGQTIVRTQPGGHEGDLALGDLLFPRADSPMFIARASPAGARPFEEEQPFRFGRWLAALHTEVLLDGQRALWLAALPAFLWRARRSRGDTELLFLKLIARLHEERLLAASAADQVAAAAVLGHLAGAIASPTNMLATNGEALFAHRAAGPLYYCTFSGIADCAPCRLGVGYTSMAATVEAHRRFRAVCVSSHPFETEAPWHEIPARTVLVVGLDASTRLVGNAA